MSPDEEAALGAEGVALEGEHITADEASAGAEESPQPKAADVLAIGLRKTFDVLAPAWGVSDDECAMLGASYGALIEKYFPNIAVGPEAAAIGVTFAVFGSRWGKPRKIEPEETPAAAPDG